MKNFFEIKLQTENGVNNNAVVDSNAVERLANAWAGNAKLKVRFKTVAGKAQVRIMADFGNRNGKMKVDEYLMTEHLALEIEALETEMFKQDALSGRKLIFLKDFVTEDASYLHVVSKFFRGEVNYYVKRTDEIEQFLAENNLVTFKLIA